MKNEKWKMKNGKWKNGKCCQTQVVKKKVVKTKLSKKLSNTNCQKQVVKIKIVKKQSSNKAVNRSKIGVENRLKSRSKVGLLWKPTFGSVWALFWWQAQCFQMFSKKTFFGNAAPAIKKREWRPTSAVTVAFSKIPIFGKRTPYSTLALRGPKVAGRRCVFILQTHTLQHFCASGP